MDIVIPYGGDGESIKYALRSIEKNFDYGNIFIVTDKPCHHLNHKNLFFINKGDKHMSNKDANLFDKVIAACENGVGEDFVFWSDDQAILRHHNIQYVYNVRNPLKNVSKILDGEIDASPKITPVLDLSNVMEGNKLLNNMIVFFEGIYNINQLVVI